MAALIIRRMDDDFMALRDREAAAESFARAVHDSWGVGDAERQDGVLVFVSVEDRAMYVSVGSGVGNTLTNDNLDILVMNMKPYLRKNDFGGALEYAVTDIRLLLEGKKRSTSHNEGYIFAGITTFFIALFGWSVIDNRRKENLVNGKKKLESLMREVASAKETVFTSKSCPICLEDFPPENNDDKAESSSSSTPLLTDKSPTRPMALQCGHVFCFSCLNQHLKTSNAKCPICRKNADGSPSPVNDTRPPGQPCSTEDTREYNENLRSSDLLYRIHRMHTLYPTVMPIGTRRRMEASIQRGDMEGLRVVAEERMIAVQRVVTDIVSRQQAISRGARGSSMSSFGGGSSSGGRGGSW